MDKNSKIIIPGAAGLVGQNLIIQLKNKGYKNIVALDKQPKNVKVLKELHNDIKVIEADLSTNGDWEKEFENADVVLMLQAQIGAPTIDPFIKNNINSLQNLDMFTKEGVDRVLKNYEELQEYYNKQKITSNKNNTEDIETIKVKLNKLLSSNGWNHGIEELLASISIEQHQKWLIEDREYFEIVFNFISWINGFSGDKPFNIMYTNIINVYKELSKEERYKHKMKFIIDRFKISI